MSLCQPPFPLFALNPSISSFFWCGTRRKKANQECSPAIWDCVVHPGGCDMFVRGAGLAASSGWEFNISLVSSGMELHPFCWVYFYYFSPTIYQANGFNHNYCYNMTLLLLVSCTDRLPSLHINRKYKCFSKDAASFPFHKHLQYHRITTTVLGS